jgi:hypothetical protein
MAVWVARAEVKRTDGHEFPWEKWPRDPGYGFASKLQPLQAEMGICWTAIRQNGMVVKFHSPIIADDAEFIQYLHNIEAIAPKHRFAIRQAKTKSSSV